MATEIEYENNITNSILDKLKSTPVRFLHEAIFYEAVEGDTEWREFNKRSRWTALRALGANRVVDIVEFRNGESSLEIAAQLEAEIHKFMES